MKVDRMCIMSYHRSMGYGGILRNLDDTIITCNLEVNITNYQYGKLNKILQNSNVDNFITNKIEIEKKDLAHIKMAFGDKYPELIRLLEEMNE